MTDNRDPQALAVACCEALKRGDGLIQQFGISIDWVDAGSAQLSMTVLDWMTNGHGSCHGGMIFSLADSAFAFACNSENRPNVAASVTIDYLNAAQTGELLIAKAHRTAQRGRTGIYDIQIENSDGRLIALFRGKSHELNGQILENSN